MKLSYKNTLLVGLAFLTVSAFWQMYDFYIPLILRDTFLFNDTTSGFIMSLDNIVALFMLPLFGILSDRTNTRIGRRIPFIIVGTVAAIISMMIIPYATHTKQIVLFVAALAFVLISMAFYRSPAVALMPDVTPKPLRSKGNAIINLMGTVGGALFLLLSALIGTKSENSDTVNFIAVASIMLVGTVIMVSTVNEPKLVKKMRLDSAAMGIDPEEAKQDNAAKPLKSKLPRDIKKSMGLILTSIFLWFMGYNAITTAFSKYVIRPEFGMAETQAKLILMVAIVAAAIAFIPIGFISSKIGRRKSILGGIVLLTAVFATAFLYTEYSPLMYVSFAFAGIAWAAINVNSLPMVLEMSKGANVGQYTGYYYTFSMAAQIVTPILSGALLQYVGYKTLFPYAAIFVALAFITMWMVKHGDSKPVAPVSKLEAFDSAD